MCEAIGYVPSLDFRGIAREVRGELVGVIAYDHWTENSVQMHSWLFKPGAVTRDYLKECFKFPFENGRDIVLGVTRADNAKALRFNKHIGFREMFRLKDSYAKGVDGVIQELRHDECRWYKRGS